MSYHNTQNNHSAQKRTSKNSLIENSYRLKDLMMLYISAPMVKILLLVKHGFQTGKISVGSLNHFSKPVG